MKKFILEVLKDSAITILCLSCATGLGILFHEFGIHETNIVVVYVLSVLLTARFTRGYFYGIIATISCILLFNWFFTEPYFTLKVNDPTYGITFAIMTITAIITGALTTKVKKAAAEAREREFESNALYKMTNHFTDASGISEIASITVKTVSDVLNCNAACVCYDENGEPEHTFIQQKNDGSLVRRELEEKDEIKNKMINLHTQFDIGNEFYDWPIYGCDGGILGVIRIPKETGEIMDKSQIKLLHAIMENCAMAMERYTSIKLQEKTREEIAQERYRSNLLRAISHDIRTPLSGIMGTSEMLMSMTDKEDKRYSLEKDIYKDADWLHSLVENILNLTKLQDGHLVIEKQSEAVEEVVGVAVNLMEKRMPEREINVNIPDGLIMVPMDIRLINQVLVNLLDNAVKHTEPGEEISIDVHVDEKNNQVKFTVSDRGRGIKEEDIDHIFQMFYTTRENKGDARRGVGLGLAICQSIVEAHGGKIFAKNRDDGRGAEISFTLPMEDIAL